VKPLLCEIDAIGRQPRHKKKPLARDFDLSNSGTGPLKILATVVALLPKYVIGDTDVY
jgi:hypothetical protein